MLRLASIGLLSGAMCAAGVATLNAQQEQAAPPRTPGAVTSPGNAKWASTPDEAKALAAAGGKFVYLEFDRPECGQCQRMDALLYPAFDFEALLISMVPVKLSLDSSEGRELGRRYGIRETPAVLITTAEGRIVFLMQGGFTGTNEFYQHVRQDLAAYRAFSKRIEGQDLKTLAPKEALDTGRELYQRSDPAAALPRLRRAVSAQSATPAVRDEAREILAAVELDLGTVAESRRTIDRLIQTTKDPRRRERAELFRAQIPLAENKPAEALALFRKFEKDHPNSPYTEQVRAMLSRLTEPAPK
ncbi:MAG TPA: hypothetical protein VE007_06515 [Thermoanaerobaculia bacterium]|nr:hypothetical protein [Thermoanaerobaculia bacterium]